jgi:hypothetical protein
MKKDNYDIVKRLIDEKGRKLGALKRNPENEMAYAFSPSDGSSNAINDLAQIGFNTRCFIENHSDSAYAIYAGIFTWDKSYNTYYIQSTNGNFLDTNIAQYSNILYCTEICSRTTRTINLDILASCPEQVSIVATYSIYVNNSLKSHGILGQATVTESINVVANEYTRIAIFLYTENANTTFKLSTNFGQNILSWRLPVPEVPSWKDGYPTSRIYNNEIDLSWDNGSIYSIGNTAQTVIEYSSSENGTYSELARVNYDTSFYAHTGLLENEFIWYRLRVIDQTSNYSEYSTAKDGSTICTNSPSISVFTYKDDEICEYYKSGDTMDIHVISQTPLSSHPEVYITNSTESAIAEAILYETNENDTYLKYSYLVTTNATVAEVADQLMPEGLAEISIGASTLRYDENSAANLIANGAFMFRYSETGHGDVCTMPLDWNMLGYKSGTDWIEITRPYYYRDSQDTGKVGGRFIRVGGPGSTTGAASGYKYYSESGARFVQNSISIDNTDDYSLSFYSRVADVYDVLENKSVSTWMPKLIIGYYSGLNFISDTVYTVTGTKDWVKNYISIGSGEIPDGTDNCSITLTSDKTKNYVLDGCFSDFTTWWSNSVDTYEMQTNTDTILQSHIYISGAAPQIFSKNCVFVSGYSADDLTFSFYIKNATDSGVSLSGSYFKYKESTSSSWVGRIVIGDITYDEWIRLSCVIPSGVLNPAASGLRYMIELPDGHYYITCVQLEIGSGATFYEPGDLQVNFDAIMLETGTEFSNFMAQETDYSAWNISSDNEIYFDHTSSTGGFYISAIDRYTSNDEQSITNNLDVFLLPTGIGTIYPYDEYGINKIFFKNSGEVNYTEFDYLEAFPYQWTLATGSSGIRKVYCYFEDNAGNQSAVCDDTITYISTLLPSPTGLSATGDAVGSNTISWNAIVDTYNVFSFYEVCAWWQVGDVYDASKALWTMQTESIEVAHPGVESNVEYFYSVRCYDNIGNSGAWATYASCTSMDFGDSTSPASPIVSGVTSDGIDTYDGDYNVYIDASITHSGLNESPPGGSCNDLHIIECALRKTGTVDYNTKYKIWDSAPASGTFPITVSFRFDWVTPLTNYYVKARAIDFAGNPSEWSSETLIQSAFDNEVPDAVTNIQLAGIFESVLANWDYSGLGVSEFIILRGDLTRISKNTTNAINIGDTRLTLNSTTGINDGDFIVINPNALTENRFIVKDVVDSTHIDIYGYAPIYTENGVSGVIYPILARPYSTSFTDSNCEIDTTYYYNILSVDNRYNVSPPYSGTNLTNTGYTGWPNATTIGIETVDLDWEFLSNVTTINLVKNSSFEIQSGGSENNAYFWTPSDDNSIRMQSDYSKHGEYILYLGVDELATTHVHSAAFPAESGAYVASVYLKNGSATPTGHGFLIVRSYNGASWSTVQTITGSSTAQNVWDRIYGQVTMPVSTVSGELILSGDTQVVKFDCAMMQEGEYVTQWIPYSDEFVLGAPIISSVEITEDAILAPHIAANAVEAQHILAGAIGTHHLTVANRKIDASNLHFYPNRNDPPENWNDDTSGTWPTGDDSWNPKCIFWTAGSVQYQSGSTAVGTYNNWVTQTVASGAYTGASWSSTYYLALKYQVTTSGEPVGGGTTTIEGFSSISGVSANPGTGYARLLIGRLITGTGDNDPTGATYESIETLGTTIDGNSVKTGSIEARMIIADAIHAEHIAADEINGDHIAANSIDVDHIQVGSRGRIYGHNLKFYINEFEPGRYAIGSTGGQLWVTGHTYNINDEEYGFVDTVYSSFPNRLYYIYYDTASSVGGDVIDTGASILVSGHKYALAKFIWSTNTNVTGFELEHIWGFGTYIDGSRISASSITAVEIAADSITGNHIQANVISGEHIYGGYFDGIGYHATDVSGAEIWINSGGNTGDIRFYNPADSVVIEIGKDLTQKFNTIAYPSGLYGLSIDSGTVFVDTSDIYDDNFRTESAYARHYAYGSYFYDGSYTYILDLNGVGGKRDGVRGLYSRQTFSAKTSPISESYRCSWHNVDLYTANLFAPTVAYPNSAGVKSIFAHTIGFGASGSTQNYSTNGAGAGDGVGYAQHGAVVGIESFVEKPGAGDKANADMIGCCSAVRITPSENATSVKYIGVLAAAENLGSTSLYGSKFYSLYAVGPRAMLAAGPGYSANSRGQIELKYMDIVPLDNNYYRLGSSTKFFYAAYITNVYNSLMSFATIPTGEEEPIELARIECTGDRIEFSSDIQISGDKKIYIGNETISLEDDAIKISTLAYVSPSGLYPASTEIGISDLGKASSGSEWHSIYLNEESGICGEYPGIFWNYSNVDTNIYSEIYADNCSTYSLTMCQNNKIDGDEIYARIDLVTSDKNPFVNIHGSLIPFSGEDGMWNLGSSSYRFNDLFLSGDIVANSIECEDITINNPSGIYALSHDSFAGFVANEHIDWTDASTAFKTSSSISGGTISTTTSATIGSGLTVTAGGATVTAGDLTITSGELKGSRQSFTLSRANLSADSYLSMGYLVQCSATFGIPMVRAGSLVGLAISCNASSHTDGATWACSARINDVAKITVTTAAINENQVYTPTPVTAARNTYTFSAGDLIQVYADLTGTCTAAIVANIEVVYNT